VVIEMFNAVLNDVIGIDGYIEAALSDLSICNANTTLGKSNHCDGDGDCDGVRVSLRREAARETKQVL
jgi:hypothetical protein